MSDKKRGIDPVPADLDAFVASETQPRSRQIKKKRHLTKRERERRECERQRIAREDALFSQLCAEKAEDRFDGEVETPGATPLWQIRGEKFDKKEIIRLDVWVETNPNLIRGLEHKYLIDWWKEKDLDGYLSSPHYQGARPKDGTQTPAAPYLVRACIALQGGHESEILDDCLIVGIGAARRARCRKCEKMFAALCKRCRSRAERSLLDRKRTTSETLPPPAAESGVKQ
jgi:hypothetical protein